MSSAGWATMVKPVVPGPVMQHRHRNLLPSQGQGAGRHKGRVCIEHQGDHRNRDVEEGVEVEGGLGEVSYRPQPQEGSSRLGGGGLAPPLR
jgi:hypothetical protein